MYLLPVERSVIIGCRRKKTAARWQRSAGGKQLCGRLGLGQRLHALGAHRHLQAPPVFHDGGFLQVGFEGAPGGVHRLGHIAPKSGNLVAGNTLSHELYLPRPVLYHAQPAGPAGGSPMKAAAPPPGRIQIAPAAIAKIAAHSARLSYGIVGMAAKDTADMLAGALTPDAHKGVHIRINADETVTIDIYVILEHGTNIQAVARSAANTVRHHVQLATGLTVQQVNVLVRGLRMASGK